MSAERLDSTFRGTLRDSHLHQFRFGTAHGTLPTKDVAFTGSWSWREGEMDCCFACTGRATLRSMSMASPAQRLSSAAGRLIQHWQWPGRLTLHYSSRRGRFHLTVADGARHRLGGPLGRFKFWRPLGASRSWRRSARLNEALSDGPLVVLAALASPAEAKSRAPITK